MRKRGFDTARIRIAPPARIVAAGVVLQLLKAGTDVAVADPWVPAFTEAMRSTGRPDVVFRFVGPTLNAQLNEQSDYRLVAAYEEIFVYEQLR